MEWDNAACSIALALDVVGTRSAMLAMREAHLGTRRFDDFVRRIGLGEPAVAARLKELVAAGLLERVPYREPGQRTRYEYQLTGKGGELLPVLTALRQWGDAWQTGPDGPSLFATHKGCGADVHAVLRCTAGHDVPDDELSVHPAG